MNKKECHVCGEMVNEDASICSTCDTDLNIRFDVDAEPMDDEVFCLSCKFYSAGYQIECQVLAKKWDRDTIEIDCPDTMRCESHRSL